MDKQVVEKQASISPGSEHTSEEQTTIESSRWRRIWPTLACSAGLFSHGYIQAVIGSVNTLLAKIYGDAFTKLSQHQNVAAIAFAGTVLSQLLFGVLSDYWSRKNSVLVSTPILILFPALSAGAYDAGGTLGGISAALIAYFFLVGIDMGGGCPADSTGTAESLSELKHGHRNKCFIFFTNLQIDRGFVCGTLVPMLPILIFTKSRLRAAWRLALGPGVVPPISLLWLRFKLKESRYNRNKMLKHPYLLILKFYCSVSSSSP